MKIESPELNNLMCAPRNKSTCNEIGDVGENIVAELFESCNIPHQMTAHDCPVDFIVPALFEDLGIEVKTSLTDHERLVLSFKKKDRDIKKNFCGSNSLSPITILIKKLPGYYTNGKFAVRWKRGIKTFVVRTMWDFETFIEGFKASVIQLKDTDGSIPLTARCGSCGRFSRSYTTGKRMTFRTGPDWKERTFEKHIYKCDQEKRRGNLWREI